jgi:hypothetical protein
MADSLKRTQTIAKTGARLKPYLAVFMGSYDGSKELTSAEILAVPLVEVGVCTKLSYTNNTKGEGKYRVFNLKAPGQFREAVPGLPDYDLNFDTVILYKQSILEAMGYGAADVGYVDTPFVLQLILMAPQGQALRVWTFRSCWFTSNPYDWEANPSEMYMTQGLKIITAGVIEGASKS